MKPRKKPVYRRGASSSGCGATKDFVGKPYDFEDENIESSSTPTVSAQRVEVPSLSNNGAAIEADLAGQSTTPEIDGLFTPAEELQQERDQQGYAEFGNLSIDVYEQELQHERDHWRHDIDFDISEMDAPETGGGLRQSVSDDDDSFAWSSEDESDSILQDDIFCYGETEEDDLLLPGSDIRVKKKGDIWVTRNDMPTKAPFNEEFVTQYGDFEEIKWNVRPPSSVQSDRFELPVSSPDFIRPSSKLRHLNNCKDPLEFFGMIVTDDTIKRVLQYTNRYAREETYKKHLNLAANKAFAENDTDDRVAEHHRPTDWTDITEIEFRAFIGAFLYLGEKNAQSEKLDDLFSTDMWSCHPLLLRAFSRNRFKEIARYLRFDDKTERPKKISRLHIIADIFDEIVSNTGSLFVPGRFVTVDEALLDFRGRVAFKMYMPGKPAKYGIKIYVLSDARTGILLDAFIYAGKDDSSENDEADENSNGEGDVAARIGASAETVLRLVKNLHDSGRVVVTDRGFTSIVLAKELRKLGLDCLGTMRKAIRGIPMELRLLNFNQYYNTEKTRIACEKKIYEKLGMRHPAEENQPDTTNGEPPKRRGRAAKNGEKKKTKRKRTVPKPPPETGRREALVCRVFRRNGGNYQLDHTGKIVEEVVAQNLDGIEKGSKSKAQPQPHDSHAAFLFSDELTLCKYVAKREKEKCPVYMLSTIHHAAEISTEKEGRPKAIKFYNKTKIGVDLLDQMVGNYSCRRATFRWPCRVWQWLMDTAALSAYKAFIMKNIASPESKMTRRNFIRQLAFALMRPLYDRRESIRPLSKRTRGILFMIAAVQKYHNIFCRRQFSLEESKSVPQLLELAATPPKARMSIDRSSNVQEHSISVAAASAPTETARRCNRDGQSGQFRRSAGQFLRNSSKRHSTATAATDSAKKDLRRRRICYATSCRKRNTTTAHSCEQCRRPVCLRHGMAVTSDRGKVVSVVCRDGDPETYCGQQSPPKKRQRKRLEVSEE